MYMDEDDEAPSAKRPNIFNIDDSELGSQDILLSEYKRKAKGEQPSGPVPEAVPISLDEGVETIGEAYVEEEGHEVAERKLGTWARQRQQQKAEKLMPDKEPPSSEGRKKSVPASNDNIEQLQQQLKIRELEVQKARREIEEAKALRWSPPGIPDTINRLLIGQPCCLEWFKTLEEKEALLHCAADTHDGNCIIAVLIYLRRTISLDVLLRLITRDPIKQPILTGHYCVHLKHLEAWNDVQRVHSLVGNHKACASFQLRRIEAIQSVQERQKELQLLQSTSKLLESDAIFIKQYSDLVDKQLMIQQRDQNVLGESRKLPFQALYSTLLFLCQWHGQDKEDSVTSPVRLQKDFNIPDKVLFQMRLMAECKRRDWVKFEQLLTSKGFFGTKLKSVIGFERVVRLLGYYDAPQEIMHPYLMEIENPDARLDLAVQYKCHNTAIETLKLMRDRVGMEDYINYIDVREQEKYRDKIQTLLANSQIKWK